MVPPVRPPTSFPARTTRDPAQVMGINRKDGWMVGDDCPGCTTQTMNVNECSVKVGPKEMVPAVSGMTPQAQGPNNIKKTGSLN